MNLTTHFKWINGQEIVEKYPHPSLHVTGIDVITIPTVYPITWCQIPEDSNCNKAHVGNDIADVNLQNTNHKFS